jgi:hypothetical protein
MARPAGQREGPDLLARRLDDLAKLVGLNVPTYSIVAARSGRA